MSRYLGGLPLQPVEQRSLQREGKFYAHPNYTMHQYLQPANQWIREHLLENRFRLSPNDPPEVIRFVFYQNLSADDTYTFHDFFFACRINTKYFKELEAQHLANPSQKAYVRAVEEAKIPATTSTFIERERFLDLFCQHFSVFYRLHKDEQDYLNWQIAKRMCDEYVKKLEMLERRTTCPWFKLVDQINGNAEDEQVRYMILDKFLDKNFVSEEWPLYLADPVRYTKYQYDLEIAFDLYAQLLKPWSPVRQMPSQLFTLCKYLWTVRFNKWAEKLQKLPYVSEGRVARIRMDAVTDMLAQIGLE